ncbi:MAG: lysozyme inhibitor LprI family protein [Cyanobium sp. CZS 25K]|nr:lysozyme inhibitor LprI family protein [Cyanobium sp. CZS25K]
MALRSCLLAPVMAAATLLAAPALAASPPTSSLPPPPETLAQSIRGLKAFPFQPDCDGNTQQIVACLWRQRNQADQRLLALMDAATLEPWRASRRRACEWVAARAEGGTLLPIVWFRCENALNQTLLKQLTTPLGR